MGTSGLVSETTYQSCRSSWVKLLASELASSPSRNSGERIRQALGRHFPRSTPSARSLADTSLKWGMQWKWASSWEMLLANWLRSSGWLGRSGHGASALDPG